MAPVPPPLGTLEPGQLRAEVVSRAIWLGVDPTINAAGAVLVGDIVGLQTDIATAIVAAAAYTDAQVATRAPVVHTHAISDVIGLPAALAAASNPVPAGVIAMWSGAIINIPAGWVLCDGNNGTPNLKDRFIVGAGLSFSVGDTGGAASQTVGTELAGGHAHGGQTQGTALSVAQLPAHAHGVNDPAHTHVIDDPGHAHDVRIGYANGSLFGSGTQIGIFNTPGSSSVAAITGVANRYSGTGISIQNAGSGQAHSHTISSDGNHNHSVTVSTMPKYYALAYIMKLP